MFDVPRGFLGVYPRANVINYNASEASTIREKACDNKYEYICISQKVQPSFAIKDITTCMCCIIWRFELCRSYGHF